MTRRRHTKTRRHKTRLPRLLPATTRLHSLVIPWVLRVSSIYTAAFASQVDELVLLEGGAPLARPVHDTIHHVRAHVQRRQAYLLHHKEPRVYPNLETAIKTRQLTATKFPGSQYLSAEAARALVERGTEPVDGGGVVFRHDPRLQWPGIQYWTQDMNQALYASIVDTPTCLLLAQDGWPRNEPDTTTWQKLLRPQVMEILPGSHHFHADPDNADAVVSHVAEFLLRNVHDMEEEQPQAKTS